MPEESNLAAQAHTPLTWVTRLPQTTHTHTSSLFLLLSVEQKLRVSRVVLSVADDPRVVLSVANDNDKIRADTHTKKRDIGR